MDENESKPLIEVGEVSDDGLRLWCARLAYDHAKKEHELLDVALQRLKTRATSLLGWVILSFSILMSVSLVQKNGQYIIQSIMILMCLSLSISMICCVKTLVGTKWNYYHLSRENIDAYQEQFKTELEIIEQSVIDIEDVTKENVSTLNKIRAKMHIAWLVFFALPAGCMIISILKIIN